MNSSVVPYQQVPQTMQNFLFTIVFFFPLCFCFVYFFIYMFCLPIKALGLLVSVIAQQPSLIQLEVEENKPLLVNKKQQTICEEIFYLNMTNTVLNFFVALLYQTKEVMFCHLVTEKPELNFTCIILHYGLLERCCSYLVFWMFQHAKCDRTIP